MGRARPGSRVRDEALTDPPHVDRQQRGVQHEHRRRWAALAYAMKVTLLAMATQRSAISERSAKASNTSAEAA
jgi:hypothetical protein